jgi:hypothetical protein
MKPTTCAWPDLGGVQNLLQFVENGGVLITARDTSVWAVEYGLALGARRRDEQTESARQIVRGSITDKKHPIATGYDDTLPLYFAGGPVFKVGFREERERESRPSGRGGKDDPDVPQGRPFIPTPERAKPAPGEEGFQLPEDAPWTVGPISARGGSPARRRRSRKGPLLSGCSKARTSSPANPR